MPRFLIDPIAQLRFVFLFGLCVLGATLAASAIWWSFVIRPAVNDLREAAKSSHQVSESLGKLMEVSSNPHLPEEQRASLAVAVGGDIAIAAAGAGRHAAKSAGTLGNPAWYLVGLAASLAFAGVCGLMWSRRNVEAELGIVRRLEGIVDGDLRLDVPVVGPGAFPILQRGMRRTVDEMRSMARRDVQLMTEVGDSVRHLCTAAAADPGVAPGIRNQLLSAADKINELRRIAQRPRL